MKALLVLRTVAGLASLASAALLVASGWALMAGYVPSDTEAFTSTLYWRQAGGLGAILQALHVHLASALVAGGFVYLATTYLANRHQDGPGAHARGDLQDDDEGRQAGPGDGGRLAWWGLLSAYLLVLGICFTGFLLPMDQDAYWGTIVRLGIVETTPIVGIVLADLLRGGAALNATTLPRFYALHVSILPFATLLVLAPLTPRLLAAARDPSRRARWLGAVLAVVAVAWGVAAALPAPLELPADPTDSEYVPRPEWYFLWLFQFGKYVEAVPWVRSFVLPVLGLGLLFALPLLGARWPQRLTLVGLWCASWCTLTGLALWDDRDLPPRLHYEAAMAARAAESYEVHCVECHGNEGRGDGSQSRAFNLGTPDLTTEDTWSDSSREAMLDAVANGKGEDMPSFSKQLSAQEIEALVDFLEASFRPAGSPG